MTTIPKIRVMILAGGQGLRLGGIDKGLLEVGGEYQIDRLLSAVNAQTAWKRRGIVREPGYWISANRHLDFYQQRDPSAHVYPDALPGFAGPLAGIATLMTAARHSEGYQEESHWWWILPVDLSHLPVNALSLLVQAVQQGAHASYAVLDGQPMYPCCLVPASSYDVLASALDAGEGVRHWLQVVGAQPVDLWPDSLRGQPVNFNVPEDVAEFSPESSVNSQHPLV